MDPPGKPLLPIVYLLGSAMLLMPQVRPRPDFDSDDPDSQRVQKYKLLNFYLEATLNLTYTTGPHAHLSAGQLGCHARTKARISRSGGDVAAAAAAESARWARARVRLCKIDRTSVITHASPPQANKRPWGADLTSLLYAREAHGRMGAAARRPFPTTARCGAACVNARCRSAIYTQRGLISSIL